MIYNFIYISFFLSVIALGFGGYLYWNLRSFNKLKNTFFAGHNGADLEQVINSLVAHMHNLQQEQLSTQEYVSRVHAQLQTAVQKVGVVRFNPFSDGGGNLSFCIALLDAYNNGLVITSMYGREQNRIYTKKIIAGTAESALTDEEISAVKQANDQSPPPLQHS